MLKTDKPHLSSQMIVQTDDTISKGWNLDNCPDLFLTETGKYL